MMMRAPQSRSRNHVERQGLPPLPAPQNPSPSLPQIKSPAMEAITKVLRV